MLKARLENRTEDDETTVTVRFNCTPKVKAKLDYIVAEYKPREGKGGRNRTLQDMIISCFEDLKEQRGKK